MNAAEFSNALGNVDDWYIMEAIAYKRKKKSGWLKWGGMAACVGLIIAAAMAALPGILDGRGNVVPPAPDVPGAVVGDGDRQPDAESSGQPEQPKLPEQIAPLEQIAPPEQAAPPAGQGIVINWDNIAVNESAGMAADGALRYYDPDLFAEETWGEEEITAWYGWNLTPGYIPEGLSAGGQSAAAHIWREKATGEIVQEQAGCGFWSDYYEDGSPKSGDDLYIPTGFTLRASRLSILHCALLPVDGSRDTDFGGVRVTITHCSMKHGPFDPTQKAPDGLSNLPAGYYDIYTASFTLDGVAYEVEAQRLALEEVVQIVASVINRPYSEDFTVGNSQSLPDQSAAPAE